jgi:hypothetical protein
MDSNFPVLVRTLVASPIEHALKRVIRVACRERQQRRRTGVGASCRQATRNIALSDGASPASELCVPPGPGAGMIYAPGSLVVVGGASFEALKS